MKTQLDHSIGNCCENIQHDLLCMLDGLDNDVLTAMCQVVVNRCNELRERCIMCKHANFSYVPQYYDSWSGDTWAKHSLIICDEGPWDKYLTVTNDAEWVVEQVASLLHGRKLLCIDSKGVWTELLVEDGKFAGFGPYARSGYGGI